MWLHKLSRHFALQTRGFKKGSWAGDRGCGTFVWAAVFWYSNRRWGASNRMSTNRFKLHSATKASQNKKQRVPARLRYAKTSYSLVDSQIASKKTMQFMLRSSVRCRYSRVNTCFVTWWSHRWRHCWRNWYIVMPDWVQCECTLWKLTCRFRDMWCMPHLLILAIIIIQVEYYAMAIYTLRFLKSGLTYFQC